MDAIQEARNYLEQYQYRINQDTFRGDPESRTRYENAAYQKGMLQAAIAQAEQLKRIADALEAERAESEYDEAAASWAAYQEQRRAHQERLDRNQGL